MVWKQFRYSLSEFLNSEPCSTTCRKNRCSKTSIMFSASALVLLLGHDMRVGIVGAREHAPWLSWVRITLPEVASNDKLASGGFGWIRCIAAQQLLGCPLFPRTEQGSETVLRRMELSMRKTRILQNPGDNATAALLVSCRRRMFLQDCFSICFAAFRCGDASFHQAISCLCL